jgi:hypothetical protein
VNFVTDRPLNSRLYADLCEETASRFSCILRWDGYQGVELLNCA